MVTSIPVASSLSGRHAKPRVGRSRRSFAAHAVVAIVGLFALVPVLWLILTSLSRNEDIFRFPVVLVRTLTLEHYVTFFSDGVLSRFMVNGLITSLITALFSLAVAFTAGYSFSKFRYRGRNLIMYTVLVAQMVPEVLLLLTLYTSFDQLGLLNTRIALVLSYTTFTLPLTVSMMKNAMDAVPEELVEAARLDGAGEWRIMSRILFPVVAPALIAVGLFAFIRAWNDLAYALTLVDTPLQTLPAGLTLTFMGEFQNSYPGMMTASLITSLPVVGIFLAFQKQFVNGALSGSVK